MRCRVDARQNGIVVQGARIFEGPSSPFSGLKLGWKKCFRRTETSLILNARTHYGIRVLQHATRPCATLLLAKRRAHDDNALLLP